jgi:hypothetical protein
LKYHKQKKTDEGSIVEEDEEETPLELPPVIKILQFLKLRRSDIHNDTFQGIDMNLDDHVRLKHLLEIAKEKTQSCFKSINPADTFMKHATSFKEMVKPDYNNWKGKKLHERLWISLKKNFYKRSGTSTRCP